MVKYRNIFVHFRIFSSDTILKMKSWNKKLGVFVKLLRLTLCPLAEL